MISKQARSPQAAPGSTPASPQEPPPRVRQAGRGRLLLVALASVALGVGLATGIGALRGDDTSAPATTGAAGDAPTGNSTDVPELTGNAEPGRPASSPEAAVTAFLDAELAGDFEESYLLLSAADRDEFRSPAGWVANHADVLPPLAEYTVAEVTGDGSGGGTVVTELRLDPRLDTVTGLVPERARATWVTVAEDGGWTVALAESSLEPHHPPDAEAPAAVQAWAESHQACAPDGEHTLVLGLPALATQLCGADGTVSVGEVAPFTEGFDTNSFLAAYGEPVLEWARVVPVTGPVPLKAVVAPVGRDWLVIGVLDEGVARRSEDTRR